MTPTDQIDALRALYSPPRARDVLASMPELAAFRERLKDPDWPTAQEVADARHALNMPVASVQPSLALKVA